MLNGCYFWAPSPHLLAPSILPALLPGAACMHPPALLCTPSVLPMVPAKKKAIEWSRNIFMCPSPLASLGCVEFSLFRLYNIHESNKTAADSRSQRVTAGTNCPWVTCSILHERGAIPSHGIAKFMALYFITQAKVILHLCQCLCLNVWDHGKCLMQKNISKWTNVIFFLRTRKKWASEK